MEILQKTKMSSLRNCFTKYFLVLLKNTVLCPKYLRWSSSTFCEKAKIKYFTQAFLLWKENHIFTNKTTAVCQNTLYRASLALARYTENYAEQGYAGVARGQKNAKQAGPRAGTRRMFCPFCESLITTGRSATVLSRCSMSSK